MTPVTNFARLENAAYREYLMALREARKTGAIDDEIDAVIARRAWASIGDFRPVRLDDQMVAA